VDKMIRVNPNGGIWRNSGEVRDITVTEDITLEAPTRQGYIFRGWKCEPGTNLTRSAVEITYVFTAQWEKDASGDGIPDKYQKKVTFRIYNGVWAAPLLSLDTPAWAGTDDDIVYYVTLVDTDGNPSETGTADISGLIPTHMRANFGYSYGKWDVIPPNTVSGTADVVYTYSYNKLQWSDIPKTGDNIMASVGVMGLSGFAAAVLLLLNRKKKQKQ